MIDLSHDDTAHAIGERLAQLLMLPRGRITGRFDTRIGDKTAAGLARNGARIMNGEKLES